MLIRLMLGMFGIWLALVAIWYELRDIGKMLGQFLEKRDLS